MKRKIQEDTVAVLYDIENAPFDMLNYALGKAQRYLPCKLIAASDWEKRPQKKCWNRLMQRQGYTFLQVERKVNGKNSLDYALFDTAVRLKNKGILKFIIITTDSDFAKIAKTLKSDDEPVYIVGVGTEQASPVLRAAYDEFICYSPPGKSAAHIVAAAGKKTAPLAEKAEQPAKVQPRIEPTPAPEAAAPARSSLPSNSNLQVSLPKSLYRDLCQRAQSESVGLDQLVTYILAKGLEK